MFFFFFFNDTATTEIYTLSLHDALPIFAARRAPGRWIDVVAVVIALTLVVAELSWQPYVVANKTWSAAASLRSEEHTSELQSQSNIVCRLLLEKKKK